MTDLTKDLVRHLRAALRSRSPATVADGLAQRAAVAVIVSAGDEPHLLFVRRMERAGDPWSGHIAFPGGFCMDGEESAAVTAERETEEETSLPLSLVGERLGQLDDVAPRTVLLPRITVTPVVYSVPERLPATPGPEIAGTAWLSAAALFDPGNRVPYLLSLPGGERVFDSIVVGGLRIWGLTERVLVQIPTIIAATA